MIHRNSRGRGGRARGGRGRAKGGRAISGSPQDDDAQDDQQLTLLQLLGSVIAGALGVQSSKNRRRDFSRGKPVQFIVAGVLFTVLLVVAVITVVNVVLNNSN